MAHSPRVAAFLAEVRPLCEGWWEPAVNADEQGSWELEWWNGPKSMLLVITPQQVQALTFEGVVPGPRETIFAEDVRPADFVAFWNWLAGNQSVAATPLLR